MNARTHEELDARVHRGVEFLDEMRPAWRKQIDPETLDLSSGHSCILSQLFGGFREGRETLGLSLAVTRALGLNYEARTNLDWLALYPGGAKLRTNGEQLEREEAETLRVLWIAQLDEEVTP